MEKSSMESETPAAAVDVEDADDDSVEIAFLDDDDDDDESDGGAAAPADEAAAAGDAGDVPGVDFGDDGGSESSEDEARPAARSGVRVAAGTVFVKASSATIFAAKDEASAAVGSVARHGRVQCEKCTDIKEVRAVADMLAGHKDVDVGRESAPRRKEGDAATASRSAATTATSPTAARASVNPDQIAMVLENARDLKFEPAILEALERKREACACLKSKWDPDWDDASRDPEQVMHQLHVFGAGDKRANGEYCRLVCCRGRDRLGDDTRPDEWCEAFNVYDEWNDAPVYVHALHKKIMLRREKINGGSRGWAVVENVDDRAHILYACFTDDLSPPFQKRAWRAYKGSPPNPQVSSTTIQEFCLARKAEGNLAYAASLDPDNRFPFDEAISAEELYTEAVEMFHDGMPVDRGLKISLYLNRAENRLTRLQPLHRARGWEALTNEWSGPSDFAAASATATSRSSSRARGPPPLALGGKNPKIRRTAALVNASIKAQEAKERDFYGKITDLSVISQ
ncbi:hypothetical protein JL720_16425 [Aureococcus anophagefferens]|nr:hypothetical protein JL720_16425 [Aureococcus anophagefferens]